MLCIARDYVVVIRQSVIHIQGGLALILAIFEMLE